LFLGAYVLSTVRKLLKEIERETTAQTSRQDVLTRLRALGLSDFGAILFSMPLDDFPKISALLPTMASDDVQRLWTGHHGQELLVRSADFIRALSFNVFQLSPTALSPGGRVLDFGCGYGRLMRLMYFFSDELDVIGVDPWSESIRVCDESRLNNVALSDYLPSSLPVDGSFNIIFAFSVFTHLSERATKASLSTLLKYLRDDGVLVITIRPQEYWNEDHEVNKAAEGTKFVSLHQSSGFAFAPHPALSPIDGDVTYGDTSMSIEWLERNAKGLKVRRVDRSLNDPLQQYVFLTK
jgi:SAM-dependent methyltransferase